MGTGTRIVATRITVTCGRLMEAAKRLPRGLLAILALSPLVAACAGGGLGTGDQVVVRRESFAVAQRDAEQICAARGRQAMFVLWQNAEVSDHQSIPQQGVYDCVGGPAPANLASGR